MEERGEIQRGRCRSLRERVRRHEEVRESMKHVVAKEFEGSCGRAVEGDICHVHEGELSYGEG